MKRFIIIWLLLISVNAWGDSPFGPIPPDNTPYNATTWDEDLRAPTKNVIRDKFESLPAPSTVLTTTITDGDLTHSPDGNSVFDALAGKANTVRQTKTISTTPVTLNMSELLNSTIYITTGASVINLPAATAAINGSSTRFVTKTALTWSLKPNGVEILSIQGTDLTGGNKITTDGSLGTSFELEYDHTSVRWRIGNITGIVIDGGA